MKEKNNNMTYEEKLIYILDLLSKRTIEEEEKKEIIGIKNKLIIQKKGLQNE